MADPLIGKQVNNFIIRERIGQGGMATVYLAYQPSVNREVALKIISLNAVPGARDEFRLRFAQEAQVIAGLEHVHILPVYDYGIFDNELAYIAMRLLRGGTLADLLVDEPLELDRTAEIFSQIALGLSYAHRKGVIHRDLKPSNIMFDDSGFAYLSDFGLAKLVENSLGLTKSEAVMGTPTYMSPEQLRGEALDNRTDIYSLGGVLYHMLVGQQPFADSATSLVSIIYQQLEKEPTPPHELNPKVTPAVEQVVLRALNKDRDARFTTADEVATALNKALGRELRSHQVEAEKPIAPPAAVALPPIGDDLITRIPSATEIQVKSRRPLVIRSLIMAGVVLVLAAALIALDFNGGQAPEPMTEPLTTAATANTDIPAQLPTEPPSTEPQPTIVPTVGSTQLAVPLGNAQGQIAFVSDRDGNDEIYVMDADGSNVQRLTNDPNRDTELSWSPDGSQIVFTSYMPPDDSMENYFMDADGSNRRLIVEWTGWEPAWSPDGTEILFGAYGDNTGDIFLVDADGSNRRALTNNLFDEGYAGWSPDGSQIVFADRQDGFEDIFIMDADGGNLRGLTDDQYNDTLPVWSPDGSQIAFQSDRDGYVRIYIIDVDGNNLHPFSTAQGDSYEASWSPDGSQIAFKSYRESNDSEIYVADADGTNIRRLTDNEAEDRLPAWRP